MNYFKELKTNNADTYDREENKPRTTIKEAADYDKRFVNRILNKTIPTEADKYNIARVVEWFDYELREINDTAVAFERIVRETLGEDVYEALTKKYLDEKMKAFEDRINGN